MDRIKKIIEKAYGLYIGKYMDGYYVELQKRVSEDEFDEFESDECMKLEDAIEQAYQFVIKKDNAAF